MPDDVDTTAADETNAWLRALIDDATATLGGLGLFDDPLMDIKPAWTLPHRILIGKVRAHGNAAGFRWFVCGELPLDHIGDDAAGTPREAARHFSMKWQLEATRQAGADAESLIRNAEALYAVVADDRLW